jgi:hypothetical protein
MLTTAAEDVHIPRLLAAVDDVLERAKLPDPPLVPVWDVQFREAARAHLDRAWAWAEGMPPPGALDRRPWPVRLLLRGLFKVMWVLNYPQRKCNQASLAALELMLHQLSAAGPPGKGASR